ncbi:M48 family metalloprotease [Candidatus Thiothrix sp. Deng01]|uniref:M48 family metalloprotease n=1 Tax=Candidatus Thiothrix phosphatis TaxID=3112415 RepID=A0ABU6CZD8_9GAMM|nr:M48 family metalloprotease [Candidatus Thiothrix sp. Deng01]MEB4591932.1 M48 family metalloprotease [Candidatus Thiothrix sp. Deng01]
MATTAIMSDDAPKNSWEGFYDKTALEQTSRRSTPDIQTILMEDIPSILTTQQRNLLSGVRIEFPQLPLLGKKTSVNTTPVNAYSLSKEKRVILPVFSIRFLRDIAIAYAWLNTKGYGLQTITDYLCMVKYQWPDQLRDVSHTPLEALGIPANALDDPVVKASFQRLFNSMIVFILGHELGHIYHQHAGYDASSTAESKRQEQDADAFALEIMRQMGAVPTGASVYFLVTAHFEPFVGDQDFNKMQANRTHPLNPERIKAIAESIKQNAGRFAAGSAQPKQALSALETASSELTTVSQLLGDQGVQASLRKIGLSTHVDMLQPRRLGELATLPGETSAAAAIFSGIFTGQWIDAKAVGLDTKMVLTRNGDTVTGTYTVGLGSATLEGKVHGDDLEYTWRWGEDYFGQGKLTSQHQGKTLTGTWGYTKASTGGGTWRLTQH